MINILYTYGWTIEKIKRFLAREDITHQQYNILRILRGQKGKPASVKLLVERMLDKSSNASRLVDKLLEKGRISPDEANPHLDHVIVAPLASTNARYPTRVAVEFLNSERFVILDQMRAVDKSRLVKKIGTIGDGYQDAILDRLGELFAK